MTRRGLSFCFVLLLAPMVVAAQANGVATSDGVYTRVQALRGQDVYAGNCRNCHTPESHTGPQFIARWSGKPLLDLYAYIRDQMPKNDPGTLTAEEYVDVTAYLLRMNRVPHGATELPVDTLALKSIRIDIGKSP